MVSDVAHRLGYRAGEIPTNNTHLEHFRHRHRAMIDYETYLMGDANEILVMAVSGRLDNEASEFFFDCVEGQIEDGNRKLVIDCRNVEYISSLGLGTLVRASSRMKKIGGDVKLARINSLLADVLKTVGLDRLFQIYPSVREACASFGT